MPTRSKQPSCYLSPALIGRRVSAKGGRAVFAVRAVRSGDILAVWGGDVLDGPGVESLRPELRRLVLQIDEDLYVLSRKEGPADWINHSCEPNAGLAGQVTLVALRDIAEGEEITYDYAMSDGSSYDEFVCGCGAARCRGRVSGFDWARPELWERYAGHFSTYLQRRIEHLRARRALECVASPACPLGREAVPAFAGLSPRGGDGDVDFDVAVFDAAAGDAAVAAGSDVMGGVVVRA